MERPKKKKVRFTDDENIHYNQACDDWEKYIAYCTDFKNHVEQDLPGEEEVLGDSCKVRLK